MATGFPFSPIRDAFNRADEDPLTATNWMRVYTGGAAAKLVSNVASPSASGYGDGCWKILYGADLEAFFDVSTTVATAGNYIEALARIQGAGSASFNAYGFYYNASGPDVRLEIITNSVGSDLTTVSQTVSSGDGLGITVKGNILTGWYRSGAGGAWTALTSIANNTWKGAGQVGFAINGAAGRVDNFGGGTISLPNNYQSVKVGDGMGTSERIR